MHIKMGPIHEKVWENIISINMKNILHCSSTVLILEN